MNVSLIQILIMHYPQIGFCLRFLFFFFFAFYQQDQYIGYSGAIPEKNVTQPNFPLFFIPNAGKYGPETLRVRTLFMQ